MNLTPIISIRDLWMALEISPETSYDRYIWSRDFLHDAKKFSVVRLKKNIVVYSSSHFPSNLAIVIATGKVVVFVNYDGNITLNTRNCLYNNQKILLAEIDKNDVDKRKKI